MICCTPATASGERAAFDRRGARVWHWVIVSSVERRSGHGCELRTPTRRAQGCGGNAVAAVLPQSARGRLRRKMSERGVSNTTDLAAGFERQRPYLRTVALRMLGSGDDADDAIQEA